MRENLFFLHLLFPYCVSNFLCNLFRTSFFRYIEEHAWRLVEVEKTVYFSHYILSHFSQNISFSAREIMLEEALMLFLFGMRGKFLLGRKCAWSLSQDEIWTRSKSKYSFQVNKHSLQKPPELNLLLWWKNSAQQIIL